MLPDQSSLKILLGPVTGYLHRAYQMIKREALEAVMDLVCAPAIIVVIVLVVFLFYNELIVL